MGTLVSAYSAVSDYVDSCGNEYSLISSRASEIKSRIEKMLYEVQSESEKISAQIVRAKQMQGEVKLKADKYQALMEDAAAELERCNAEKERVLSHPVIKSCTDENGNEYTVEEVDVEALIAAERAKYQAQQEYDHYHDKCDDAANMMDESSLTINRFEQIKNGIDAVAQSIQNDLFEIEKFIDAIGRESEHNLRALNCALDAIGIYLASEPIYHPESSNFSDFSSATEASSNHVGSSTNMGEVSSDAKPAVESVNASTSYGQISSPIDVSEKYFDKLSRRDAEGLTDEEKNNIKIYCRQLTDPPEYSKMNEYLRKGGEIDGYLSDAINSITGSISKHALPRDMTLYRGMGNADVILGEIAGRNIYQINEDCVGTTFLERGFSSTSIFQNDAMEYVKYKGALLEIRAPSGAEGIFTGEVSGYKKTEHEVILQRGSIYTIDNVVDYGHYYKIYLTLTERLNYE